MPAKILTSPVQLHGERSKSRISAKHGPSLGLFSGLVGVTPPNSIPTRAPRLLLVHTSRAAQVFGVEAISPSVRVCTCSPDGLGLGSSCGLLDTGWCMLTRMNSPLGGIMSQGFCSEGQWR